MRIKNWMNRNLVSGAVAAAAVLWAAPSFANIDLVVQNVQWLSGPKIGNCNKISITVRNNGNEIGNAITTARMRIFPTGNSVQTLVDKSVPFSTFQPGQSRTRTISNISLPADTITIQVTADASPANGVGKLAESNENNNTFTQTSITVNQACGGGQCDLQAKFGGGNTTIPGTYPAKLSVKYKNIGGANCPAKQITLARYAGTSASGSSTNIGSKSLQALAPGQSKGLSWKDSNHATNGKFTYRPSFNGGHSDANNGNHNPTRTLSFKTRGTGGGGGPSSGCDLRAIITQPQGATAPSGNINFQVSFQNIGNGTCVANKIKLTRHNGSNCTGYGSQVGGSGNFEGLPPLAVGGQTTLSWTDRYVGNGSYCYKVVYASAHNDTNNNNHHPKKGLAVN